MRRWNAPFGSFDLEIGDHGIHTVALSNGVRYESVPSDLAESLGHHVHGEPASLELDLQGVRPLGQLTLAKLLEIPFGEVRSYAWVAREIGRPTAVRAVASCVANNPVPVLIPCHRVVRSDGYIGEFSLGGPDMKRKLLAFEGVDIDRLEKLATSGIRFLGDAKTYHLTTCREAGGSTTEIRSVEDAEERRLQACSRCRPTAPIV